MNNSSERKLMYVKCEGEGELYLSCRTETSSSTLTLSQKPYPWEVMGFKNDEDTSTGIIMTHKDGGSILFVQPDSAPDKDYFDAILSETNWSSMRYVLTRSPTDTSVSIHLKNGELCLGKNKNSDALVFSLNETTWQIQEV